MVCELRPRMRVEYGNDGASRDYESWSCGKICDEFTRVDAQRLRYSHNRRERHVALAAFNRPDVGPMEVRYLGETFLRPAERVTALAHAGTELLCRARRVRS